MSTAPADRTPPGGRDRRGMTGLLTAVGISILGTRMSFLALPWFVLTTTHSAVDTGLIAFAEMAPYVLTQALGGPYVDRLGAWRTSVVGDLGAAAALGLVPLLHLLGLLPLPVLALVMAIAGVLRGAGDAARNVMVPGLGEFAGQPMERSAGLYDGVNRLAGLIGAPLAGVLIATVSALTVLAIDAATFLASALAVFALVPRRAQPQPALGDGPGASELGYFTSLREGFAFLRGDRLLLGIGSMVLVTNLIDQASSSVLTPVWAQQVAHSPIALGLIGGAFGVGAVTGNAATTWLGPRLPRRWTFAVGFALAGAPRLVALAVASSVSPVLVVAVLGGLGAGGLNPILGAVEYERVPRALQARVLGAVGAAAWAGIPVGGLVGGALVGGFGLRAALGTAAAAYALTTAAPFVFPVWKQMDRQPDSPTSPARSRPLLSTSATPSGQGPR